VTLKFQTHSEERERHTHTHSSWNKLPLQRSYPLYIYMHLFMARVPIDGTTLYTRSLTFKKLWSLYYITCPSPRGSYCHHRSVSRLPIFSCYEDILLFSFCRHISYAWPVRHLSFEPSMTYMHLQRLVVQPICYALVVLLLKSSNGQVFVWNLYMYTSWARSPYHFCST